MRCPYCNGENLRVVDSRNMEEMNATRRRRVCESCHRRFNTFERVEYNLTVIKKDQTRQPYNRQKLEDGIVRACYKRPIPVGDIQSAVNRVEYALVSLGKDEVASSVIGEMVMKELKDLDEVSYVRFASVYREFKDVGTFMEELKKIMGS